MNFKIVMDSAGEIPAGYRSQTDRFISVPLTLDIGGETIVDDGHISQKELVTRIAASSDCAKSACPSPGLFLEAYGGADRTYVITISHNLSGSYHSAKTAEEMFLEENPDAKIYVFDALSTSVGESLIFLKILELEEKGLSFEEVIEQTEAFIHERRTYFVLDNLETLYKNGRLSKMKYVAASVLHIKVICASTPDGEIVQLALAKGTKKAIQKMADISAKEAVERHSKIIGISHCNCEDRALMLRDALAAQLDGMPFLLHEAGGLSSMYANDGGVIMTV